MRKILFIAIMAIYVTHIYAATIRTFAVNDKTNLFLEKGDITKSHTQAIVNAANEQLLGGGGVCGAIFNAAGWDQLQAACDKYPAYNTIRCPVGDARITDSFNLKTLGIEYIIHAVGPDCRIITDEQLQNSLLEKAYKNSLILADKNNIRSIAFPFISSAIYACPRERACEIALRAVLDYIRSNQTKIESIGFVLFSQGDFNLFNKTLKKE